MKIFNSHLDKNIEVSKLFEVYDMTITLEELVLYYESQERYYHNFSHIIDMLEKVEIDSDILFMSIIFHDVIYDVNKSDNEVESARFFGECCNSNIEFIEKAKELIICTKGISDSEDILIKEIIRLDREILYSNNISELLEWELKIFKEFQCYNIKEYKKGRIAFLNFAYEETGNHILLELRDIVKNKVYKIGFYPGSFNPFHVGHYNILEKAEKSFDKVVIGVGINFDKKDLKKINIPQKIKNREIVYYSGLITTEINKLSECGEVFVVRGLRNAYDLQHEEALRNVIKDFLPEQEFVYFFCNREFEHISSSLIRDIQSRNDESSMASRIVNKYTLD